MAVEEIAQDLQEAQEFNGNLREFLLENFIIEDKTMTQWKRYFYVRIPEDVSFPVIIRLTQEVARKYQEASRFRDEFTVQLAILDQNKSTKYHAAFNEARTDHEVRHNKPLAAESCKSAASVAIKDVELAISNQKIIKDFWVETCRTLVEMRKHIEAMGRALAGDSWTQRDMVVRKSE